jgi:precorrin-6A synthase
VTGGPVRGVRVIGVGPGDPDQVTVQAVRAMREVAYFVVSDKSSAGASDPLVDARERLLEAHLESPPVLVRVQDPERERRPDRTASTADYEAAVAAWHDARAAAYEEALLAHEGDAGFLVWGDPAFYDSTIRVLDTVSARGRVELTVEVIPGVSSLQLLAARHGIVLHEVGQALHVTTGRRLREAVEQGQDNVVVMLNQRLDLAGLEDWRIWWGANLGTPREALVSGRVGDVVADIEAQRSGTKAAAGWVMDVYLLRR